jgi:hypothetical protein
MSATITPRLFPAPDRFAAAKAVTRGEEWTGEAA